MPGGDDVFLLVLRAAPAAAHLAGAGRHPILGIQQPAAAVAACRVAADGEMSRKRLRLALCCMAWQVVCCGSMPASFRSAQVWEHGAFCGPDGFGCTRMMPLLFVLCTAAADDIWRLCAQVKVIQHQLNLAAPGGPPAAVRDSDIPACKSSLFILDGALLPAGVLPVRIETHIWNTCVILNSDSDVRAWKIEPVHP